MTRVSVVLPIYNHEAFVGDALTSIDDQGHDDLEIICVDDGSSDSSLETVIDVAARLNCSVVTVTQDNGGAHTALNRGCALATGDLVMFLNSDDRYRPGRVNTFVRAFERGGAAWDFWGFSSVGFIDEANAVADPAPSGMGMLSHYNHHTMLATWVPELLPWHNMALTSGNLVMSRLLLDHVGGFVQHRHVHDWDMALRCLAVAEPVIVPLPLYEYRLHGTNTFSTIPVEQSERESLEVRANLRQALLARSTSAPYGSRGTPFVDFLRTETPLQAGFASS